MINLIIADDHSVIRQALCEMLESKGKYNIIAQANDGRQLLELLQTHQPDLVIVDVSMPKLDGVEAIKEMALQMGDAPPVLVLSANDKEKYVRAALKAGAKGYLPKNADVEELQFAIDSILEGKTYLSPSITAPLMSGGSESAALDSPLTILTKREIEILKHLANGSPNREIGKLLHISTRTVDTHRSNILKKLKAKTNAELVKIALSHELISL